MSQYFHIFDTFTEAQAATLPEGVMVKTKGRLSAGDGEGSEYLVQSSVLVVHKKDDTSTIARSLNVLDSQVVYSTDTTTVLDNVLYIYDATSQVTWGVPALDSAGKTIASVVGSALTTTGGTGSNSYTLSQLFTYYAHIKDVISNISSGIEDGRYIKTPRTTWSITTTVSPIELDDGRYLKPESDIWLEDVASVTEGSLDTHAEIQKAVESAEQYGCDIRQLKKSVFRIGDTVELSGSVGLHDLNLKPFGDLPALTPLLRIISDDTHKVSLYNVHLDGEKATQTQYGGAQDGGKHGLYILGDCAIYSIGLRIKDAATDCITYNIKVDLTSESPNRKEFYDTICDGGYRQGLSVGAFDKLYFYGLQTINTIGTAPQDGVDIEPDSDGNYLGEIGFYDHISSGNSGNGFSVVLNTGDVLKNLIIENQVLRDNGGKSFRTGGESGALIEKMSVKNVTFNQEWSTSVFPLGKLEMDGVNWDGTNCLLFLESGATEVSINNMTIPDGIRAGVQFNRLMKVFNTEYLKIENSDLPVGNHTSVEGGSGTGLEALDVDNITLSDVRAEKCGYRILYSNGTNQNRINIRNMNIGAGDGFNTRSIFAEKAVINIDGMYIPTCSSAELAFGIPSEASATVRNITFESSAPIFFNSDSVVHASGFVGALWDNGGDVSSTGVSITVPHGLMLTPESVRVTPINATAAAQDWYVDTIGATNFVIRGVASGSDFKWRASCQS